MGFSYTKERLTRYDTGQLAFDENIYSLRSTYQFTRFLFARGRVDYDTLQTKWDNVYAIGDCADMPASKAGGVAHQEADVLAHNLTVEITGKGRPVDLWLHTI